MGSIPIFQKYAVVGASCSLDIQSGQDAHMQSGQDAHIQSGQDARTTNLNIWDAPVGWASSPFTSAGRPRIPTQLRG